MKRGDVSIKGTTVSIGGGRLSVGFTDEEMAGIKEVAQIAAAAAIKEEVEARVKHGAGEAVQSGALPDRLGDGVSGSPPDSQPA